MSIFRNLANLEVSRRVKTLLGPGAGFVPRTTLGERLRGKMGRKNRGTLTPGKYLAQNRDADPRGFAAGGTPVFFVVGHQKSGTTWLMEMLNHHPEILCRGEGRPFGRNFTQEHLKKKRAGYPPTSLYNAIASSEDLRYWLDRSVWTKQDDTDEQVDELTRLVLEYLLLQQLSKTGKRLVGDKTVLLGPEILKEIGAIFPDAKVIHIIRDGRDVVVSTMHHRWNQAEDRGGTVELPPDQMAKREAYRKDPQALLRTGKGIFPDGWLGSNATKWETRVSRAAKDGPTLLGDNYEEVRYEALLERPEEEVGRLLRFLGAEAGEETVKRCVDAANFQRLSKGRDRGQEAASFFRKGIAGDWENVFTEQDKRDFKSVAGDLLISLGYERDDDW